MKKVVLNLLAVAVLTTLTALTSCDDDHGGERVISEGRYQILYADQTQSSTMGMTSNGAFEWWASIEEPERSPWIISITPESGGKISTPDGQTIGTGKATFVVNVEPNTSGIDREAIILFKFRYMSRKEVLVDKIRIMQKATTMDGQLYEVPESQ